MTMWDTLAMREPRLDPGKKRWTEAEYLALGENHERQELIDGELTVSPNANNAHNHIGYLLKGELLPAARKSSLTVCQEPNLRLAALRYLIPDLAVGTFGRRTLINAATDALLVAEITAPSNAATDREKKKRLYAEAGIKWYLLVEPEFADYESVTLRLFRLEEGTYVEHAVAKPGETLLSDEPFPLEIDTAILVDF